MENRLLKLSWVAGQTTRLVWCLALRNVAAPRENASLRPHFQLQQGSLHKNLEHSKRIESELEECYDRTVRQSVYVPMQVAKSPPTNRK